MARDMADQLPDEEPTPRSPIAPGSVVTEDLAAREFADIYAGQLAYCCDHGAWFQFDNSIWRLVKTPLAFHYAREMCRRLSYGAPQGKKLQEARFSAAVERFAKSDPVFSRTSETWDQDQFLLGTPNGTVDLRTGRLRRSNHAEGITKATAVPPLPTAFCPRWIAFLNEATNNDPDLIRFLQQIAGYCLTGDTREHALFFIYGPGGNGKSVFINTINSIAGDYAATASMDSLTAGNRSSVPADLAMLRGARLVTASETEEGQRWAKQRITQMTGGDLITARFMRENFFTFKPQFKLLIVGNHKPSITTVDLAMRRRFNIIPFTVTPKQKDPNLEEALKEEWPGILRWMIEGCLLWQSKGLLRSGSVADATKVYFEQQDLFQQWIEDRCEIGAHLQDVWSPLFKSWKVYAEAAGDRAGDSRSFAEAMEKRGYERFRTKDYRGFKGLALKLESDGYQSGDR